MPWTSLCQNKQAKSGICKTKNRFSSLNLHSSSTSHWQSTQGNPHPKHSETEVFFRDADQMGSCYHFISKAGVLLNLGAEMLALKLRQNGKGKKSEGHIRQAEGLSRISSRFTRHGLVGLKCKTWVGWFKVLNEDLACEPLGTKRNPGGC